MRVLWTLSGFTRVSGSPARSLLSIRSLAVSVKQEILLTDVTTCYNTLKKAVQEIHAASSATAQLQMGHPNVRYVNSHNIRLFVDMAL